MLVSTDTLQQRLDDPSWVIFDCRHDLMDHGRGARLYHEGHISGAHFAAVETNLSGAKTGQNGRHPLPSPAVFTDFLSAHGVSNTSTIVAYDDVGGMYAARLWWLAKWIGLQNVAMLDGGWPKWVAEGRLINRDIPVSIRASLTAHANPALVWTATDVLRHLGDSEVALLDARTPERHRGDVEPIDPRAGRIPGALNRFYKKNLNPDLTFRPATELQREFTELIGNRDPDDVVHYCGSGITASANLFAMEYAGLAGSKLYNGSWSEWLADPTRPTDPPRPA